MVLDYVKLGLKVGLEIHQQLSGEKLFCNCPAEINDTPSSMALGRYLRATAGEGGEVDIAAQAETLKQRRYVYHIHHTHACLVETDEEPPHPMNNDALHTALLLAKLLNAKIVDEVQVMRKIVVDGSNTTGFQRTALVAMDGSLTVNKRTISVPTICLEEDSAKIVAKEGDVSVYNLSRLGIPLIEIATGPDIQSPDEAREVAEKIGMFLRSTGRVKRGLGTIRQDLNISIRGGTRIEIKGAQELHLVPLLVENEIQRQMRLLELKKEFEKKGKGTFQDLKIVDLSSVFKNTPAKIVKDALHKKGVVLGCKLEHMSGFLGKETQPGKRFGTEVSEYAKVAAGVRGIFHSDELPAYGISVDDVAAVRKALVCKQEDAFLLVAEQREIAQRALHAACARAQRITEGVLKEVRNANPDGTTSYLRPLPGAARMYPETDIPPIVPNVHGIQVPELIEEKSVRYEQTYGLSKDLATKIAKSDHMMLFEELVHLSQTVKPAFIAETLVAYEPEIMRNYKEKNPDVHKISDEDLKMIFLALHEQKIAKEDVLKALLGIALGKQFTVADYKHADVHEIEAVVKDIVKEYPDAAFGLLMGRCMAALQGKADGKTVSELLKKYVK